MLVRVLSLQHCTFIQFFLMTGHLTSTLPCLGVQALRGMYMGSPFYQFPVPYYGYQSGVPYLPYRLVKSLPNKWVLLAEIRLII